LGYKLNLAVFDRNGIITNQQRGLATGTAVELIIGIPPKAG
jgi:hypothetical protein